MSVKFLAQGNLTTSVASNFPVIQLEDWNNESKVPCLRKNNKQHYLGIESGSSVSLANPKLLLLLSVVTTSILTAV